MPPLTGLVRIYGTEISRAGQIACQEVNEAGGVLGKPLELVIEDDGSLPGSAVIAARRLVHEHHCAAIIGNLLSNSRIAVAYQVAEPSRIPYLNFSFYEGSILSRYFFHFAALPNQQIDRMIPYMRGKFGPRMFFAGNNYEWPRGSIDAAKRALADVGGEVVGEEYCPLGVAAQVIEALLDQVDAAAPDVFVPYFAGDDQLRLLTRFAQRGMKQRMAVIMGHFDEVMASQLGAEAREGLYSCNTYFMGVDTPQNRSVLAKLGAWQGVDALWPRGNGILTNFGEATYLCVKAFAIAANRAGSLDAEELVDALADVELSGPQGKVHMDPATHHARVNTYLARCQSDGEFAVVEAFGATDPALPERYRHLRVAAQPPREEDIRLQSRILEHMPAAVLLVKSEDARIIYVNPGGERMFGFRGEELIGKPATMLDAGGPGDVETSAVRRLEILLHKGSWQGEIRMVRKDGTTLWCSASDSVFTHPAHGEVWMSVLSDITERERADETFRGLLESAPDAMVVVDGSGTIVRVNSQTERMFGYARQELLGQTVEILIPQRYGSPHRDQRARYFAAPRGRPMGAGIDSRGLRKDHTEFPIEISLSPLQTENGGLVCCAIRDISERKRAEEAMRASRDLLRSVIEHAPIRVFWKDHDLRYLGCNILFARDAGMTHPEELLGKDDFQVGWREQAELYRADDKRVMDSNRPKLGYEEPQTTPDGRSIWLRTSKVPLHGADGSVIGILGIYDDITQQKEVEERIRRLNRVHAVLSGINSAIVRIRDRKELFEEASRIAVESGGFVMAWVGRVDPEANVVRPEGWAGREVRSFLDTVPLALLETMPGGQGLVGRAVRERRPMISNDVLNDPQRPMKAEYAERGINSIAILPLLQGDEATGLLAFYAAEVGVFDDEEMRLLIELTSDVSFALDYMAKAERVNYLAYYDALTGLPNRSLLLDRLRQALHFAERHRLQVGVLAIDLDRFKFVNDSLGHAVGDEVLEIAANRMSACVREGDTLARVGGDEFVVVLAGMEQDGRASSIAQRILDALAKPFMFNEREVFLGCSIGVALYPRDGEAEDTLLKNADAAMYRVKDQGGNACQFYTPDASDWAHERLLLEAGLRHALEREEFQLHYQPQVDLRTGQVTGLEALIRWKAADLGWVSPTRFIPVAEETGLILPIGEWVLRTACAQNKAWQDRGLPQLRMAVNLSSRQFRQKDLAGKIRTVLAETGCDPKYLELELTESMLVQNAETAIAVMSELRRIGIRISLDDFGTGYASLSYLKRFPIDTLKIDQSFVREVTSDANSAAIADAIIGMAHSLRLTVLAEGVETEGQLAWLRTRGCDQMQGYLFCKPVPSGELAELLRERRCLPTRARAAAGPTLLLLDDEQNVLSALRRALRADNYRILTADSPKAAFELLAQNTIQVIVSDQRMPEMNGTEFFGRVKDLYPDTVRIMLSEYSEIQAVTEAINRGAVYKYLHKPWEDEVLRATIKEAFQIQRSEAIGISSLSTAADYRCVLDEIAGERGALPRLV